jgi:hypothetical protein
VVEDATSAMNKQIGESSADVMRKETRANVLLDFIQMRIHTVRPQSLKRVFALSVHSELAAEGDR